MKQIFLPCGPACTPAFRWLLAGLAASTLFAFWGCSRQAAPGGRCGCEMLTAPLEGSNIITTDETCFVEEVQEGHLHRVVCDGDSCLWFVDDVLTCVCEQLDYSNTCTNSVPLCAEWLEYFDFR